MGFRPKFGFASDWFVFVLFIYGCCSLELGFYLGFRPINKILDDKKKKRELSTDSFWIDKMKETWLKSSLSGINF